MTHYQLYLVSLSILLHVFLIPSYHCQPPSDSSDDYIDYFDQLAQEIKQPLIGVNRTYYVAIDEVLWDYAPSGRDQVHGTTLEQSPARFYTMKSKDKLPCCPPVIHLTVFLIHDRLD
jgi:hypothetical protein